MAMIQRLGTLDAAQVEPILVASQREGFRFVTRLCEEWASGVNRFERPGEALFGVFVGADLVGIGGLNRQTESTGRLRRFYILPPYRRQGWGRRLLRHILTHAAEHFRCVVLQTDTDSADRFYRACGFARAQDSGDVTHTIELASAELDAPPNGGPGRSSENSDASCGPPSVS